MGGRGAGSGGGRITRVTIRNAGFKMFVEPVPGSKTRIAMYGTSTPRQYSNVKGGIKAAIKKLEENGAKVEKIERK